MPVGVSGDVKLIGCVEHVGITVRGGNKTLDPVALTNGFTP
jgi:hypothetical protein